MKPFCKISFLAFLIVGVCAPHIPALAQARAAQGAAQTTESRDYVSAVQTQFANAQDLVAKSAQKAGEDVYSFKPTPEVRSFAGVVGHVADGNMLVCRAVSGEAVDYDRITKDLSLIQVHEKKTAKADLIKALGESRAFCESAFAKLTDASAKETVSWFGGQKKTKLSLLMLAADHGWEHYGNLVTYLRLKGIVPPSSEPPPSSRN